MRIVAACMLILALISTGTNAQNCFCVGDLTDDFSDGSLSPHWVIENIPCGSIVESGGALQINRGVCLGTASVKMEDANQIICGDFDIWVDFSLSSFSVPPSGSRWASFGVFNVGQSRKAVLERYNRSSAGDCVATSNYKAYVDNSLNCTSTTAPTSDQSGRFRIRRVGADVEFYVWSGSWTLFATKAFITDDVYIKFFAGTDQSATAFSVVYDNLSITSQSCPTGVGDVPDGSAHLTQSYPNPFSASVSIGAKIPAGGAQARLEIFDAEGRRVRTLQNGWMDGGAHDVTWDGRDDAGAIVRSGVYFCRISSGSGRDAKKLVLLR